MKRIIRLKSERREEKRKKARSAPKGGTLAATHFKIGVNRGYVRKKKINNKVK